MPHCLSQIIWHDGYSYVIGCGLIQTKATANEIIFSAWFDFIYKKNCDEIWFGGKFALFNKRVQAKKKSILKKKKEIKCKITCIKHSYFEKTPNQLTFHKLSFKNILGYLTIKWL